MTRTDVRVVVVTGGASGIGLAIAQRVADEGACVVVADVDRVAGGSVERDGLQFVPTDVTDEHSVSHLFDHVRTTYGQLDALVASAGVAHGPAAEFDFVRSDEEMARDLIGINLEGVLRCCRHAVPLMKQRGGTIVTLSSGGATRAHRRRVVYDATKGGIEAATRALALDLATWSIRVNAVAPGAIEGARRTPIGGEHEIAPSDVIPLGRLGRPEDVAGVVSFLLSSDAAYITGAIIAVDGGLTAQLRCPVVDTPAGDLALEANKSR